MVFEVQRAQSPSKHYVLSHYLIRYGSTSPVLTEDPVHSIDPSLGPAFGYIRCDTRSKAAKRSPRASTGASRPTSKPFITVWVVYILKSDTESQPQRR